MSKVIIDSDSSSDYGIESDVSNDNAYIRATRNAVVLDARFSNLPKVIKPEEDSLEYNVSNKEP